MADLPIDRVEPCKPPFNSIGVDYFGPFVVKRGRSHVKSYLLSLHLFDCESYTHRSCAFS